TPQKSTRTQPTRPTAAAGHRAGRRRATPLAAGTYRKFGFGSRRRLFLSRAHPSGRLPPPRAAAAAREPARGGRRGTAAGSSRGGRRARGGELEEAKQGEAEEAEADEAEEARPPPAARAGSGRSPQAQRPPSSSLHSVATSGAAAGSERAAALP
ncbi:unnamed protein product, partial [Prorocentrum cordatum]